MDVVDKVYNIGEKPQQGEIQASVMVILVLMLLLLPVMVTSPAMMIGTPVPATSDPLYA